MTKQEDLDKIDELVRKRMIELLEDEDKSETSKLPELATAVNYLAKNNIVAEKTKSSVEETVQKRVRKANARRAKKDSE